jgi:hypothetical protein
MDLAGFHFSVSVIVNGEYVDGGVAAGSAPSSGFMSSTSGGGATANARGGGGLGAPSSSAMASGGSGKKWTMFSIVDGGRFDDTIASLTPAAAGGGMMRTKRMMGMCVRVHLESFARWYHAFMDRTGGGANSTLLLASRWGGGVLVGGPFDDRGGTFLQDPERRAFAAKLRAVGIPAEWFHPPLMSTNSLLAYCKERGFKYLVTRWGSDKSDSYRIRAVPYHHHHHHYGGNGGAGGGGGASSFGGGGGGGGGGAGSTLLDKRFDTPEDLLGNAVFKKAES